MGAVRVKTLEHERGTAFNEFALRIIQCFQKRFRRIGHHAEEPGPDGVFPDKVDIGGNILLQPVLEGGITV